MAACINAKGRALFHKYLFADARKSHKNYLKYSLYEWFIPIRAEKRGARKSKIISDSGICPTQEMWDSIHCMSRVEITNIPFLGMLEKKIFNGVFCERPCSILNGYGQF